MVAAKQIAVQAKFHGKPGHKPKESQKSQRQHMEDESEAKVLCEADKRLIMAHVLLGLCEEPVTSSTVTCWNVNKLGGTPDWYQSTDLHPNCSLCGHRSVFICQLYCPISGSSCHRTLYVFACCNQPCRNKENSWIVLRFQSPYKPEPKRSLLAKCDTDYWGLDEASWSDEEDIDKHHTPNSAKPEPPKTETEACSTKSAPDHMMDIEDQEPSSKLDKSVAGRGENGETNIKKAPNGGVCTEEAVEKISQLTVMDVECIELETSSDVNVTSATDKEVVVVAEDLLLNPEDSILSKVLLNSSLSSAKESITSQGESFLASVVLDSYYINVYDEAEFVVDTKHWLELERKYLKEDSALRSYLQECDELPSGKPRKEKKSKKPSHLDTEKDDNNEYDKKPGNFDRAVVKFSEKLKLCPLQVVRYSYNGTPLHFQERALKQRIPTCACGSPRIFEMQLMPGMVDYLKLSADSDCLTEFGSVYIYTCAKNCWTEESAEAKQEFIFSVEYLDQGLFRT